MTKLPRLCDFNFFTRVGLTGLLITFAIGQLAALYHTQRHYDNRDERKGFTLDDIRAAYHGINAPSPLSTAIAATPPHPADFKAADRDVLTKWLASGKIDENFDNPDLGPASPKEIIAASCLKCHSVRAGDEKARALPLDTLSDVKRLAFPRQVNPTPIDKVAVSTHAHAPALASMAFIVFCMALMTRWWKWFVGMVIALVGVSLALDISSWWLARDREIFVPLIYLSGLAFNVGIGFLLVITFFDLWIPGGRSPE